MGALKNLIIELEEEGVIVFSDEARMYVMVEDLPELVPFDPTDYLYHKMQKSHGT